MDNVCFVADLMKAYIPRYSERISLNSYYRRITGGSSLRATEMLIYRSFVEKPQVINTGGMQGSRGSELMKIKSRAHFFCMSCCFSYNCSVVSLTKNISEPMKHQLNRKILKYKRDSLRHSKAQKFLVQCLDAVFAF